MSAPDANPVVGGIQHRWQALRDQVETLEIRRPWTTEASVAALAILTAVLARMAIEVVVGGVAPFMLTFPATLIATLLVGARSGAATAIGCQLLTVQYVFPNWTRDHGGTPTDVANLLLATLSLGLMIWAAASFRRLSMRLRAQCEREVETLSLLIGEMDHRTKNNFQLAAALLDRQSRDSGDPALGHELGRAAARLQSIASVYRNLGVVGSRAGEVTIDVYLGDVLDLLRRGYLPPTIALDLASDSVKVPAQVAMMIGLIVNEWVTNAVKYAFYADGGRIAVAVRQADGALEVTVSDDGLVPATVTAAGTGSRLIAGLAKAVDATVRIDHDGGTRCRLTLPLHRRG